MSETFEIILLIVAVQMVISGFVLIPCIIRGEDPFFFCFTRENDLKMASRIIITALVIIALFPAFVILALFKLVAIPFRQIAKHFK